MASESFDAKEKNEAGGGIVCGKEGWQILVGDPLFYSLAFFGGYGHPGTLRVLHLPGYGLDLEGGMGEGPPGGELMVFYVSLVSRSRSRSVSLSSRSLLLSIPQVFL